MVTHLTKPAVDASGLTEEASNLLATENLITILKEGVLRGSTTEKGFIVGNMPAVCFQDAPLYGLIQNVQHEYQRREKNPRERYRYCGVGLAFSKWYVFTNGGRPVLYEQTETSKNILPPSEYWRIVNFSIRIGGDEVIDWTHEREWRVPRALQFERKFAHVVLYDKPCWDHFLANCPPEILYEIYGVTVLKSILM
jgi:hypothetical protein